MSKVKTETELISNNLLQNAVKVALDSCKEAINSTLAKLDFANTIDLKQDDFIIKRSYEENQVFNIIAERKNIGKFLHTQGYFIPLLSRISETPYDKEDYNLKRSEFLINNCDSIKLTDSSIKTLQKNLDGSEKAERVEQIINSISSLEDFVDISFSYRINNKKAQELVSKKDFLNSIESIANKEVVEFYGLSIYQMFGYEKEQDTMLKLTQSQKDKIITILLNEEGLNEKKKIEEIISALSLEDRLKLVEPLNLMQTDLKNSVALADDLKKESYVYSTSVSYSIDAKDLEKNLKISKQELQEILRAYNLNPQSDTKFKYEGEQELERKYYIKNNAFKDLNGEEFRLYVEKDIEQKELLDSIKLNSIKPTSAKVDIHKKSKLKIK